MRMARKERDARIGNNKQWYRDHPKTRKFLKAVAALTLVLFLIGLFSDGGTEDGAAPVADAPVAVADTDEDEAAAAAAKAKAEEEAAAAAVEAEEEAKAEEEARRAAARQARIDARKEAAKQARIEARKEAARQARIEARKEAARQRRVEERKARQAAAAERRREAATQVSYANCSEVEAAGAAPIYAGEPGFGSHLDRDGDGVACEQ